MEKLLATFKEASEITGLGRSKLYELVAQGEIETVKIGRARRFPVDALQDFVARIREEAAEDRRAGVA